MTTISLCYVHVPGDDDHEYLASQFLRSYEQFQPLYPHKTFIITQESEPRAEFIKAFDALPECRNYIHDDSGWDIGGYIALAKSGLVDTDILLCCGGSTTFRRQGWMARMVEAWDKHGPGFYGSLASFQIRPHFNTNGFWLSPRMLAEYPAPVVTKEDRYEFEHGSGALWWRLNQAGYPTKLVTWDGEYDWKEWRSPENISCRGDQSNCLTFYRINYNFERNCKLDPVARNNTTYLTDTHLTDPCFRDQLESLPPLGAIEATQRYIAPFPPTEVHTENLSGQSICPSDLPLVTVLIPTRERADTLVFTLTSCLKQRYDRLRIVVSDNFSQDHTKSVVSDFIQLDQRVSYINPGRRLSMSSHWEWALGQVEDGYVIVVGDDDAVVPNAIDRLAELIALNGGPDALSWPMSYYHYPQIQNPKVCGRLHIDLNAKNEWRETDLWLRRLLHFQTPYFELPTLYHNCIHTRLLSRLREMGLPMIRSRFPDVYLAIAISTLVPCHLRLSRSVTINAVSAFSNGYSQLVPESSKVESDRFVSESDIPLHAGIYYVNSLHVITVEAALQARDALDRPDLTPDWNHLFARLAIELAYSSEMGKPPTMKESDILQLADSIGGECRSQFERLRSVAMKETPNWELYGIAHAHYVPNWVGNLDLRDAGVADSASAAAAARILQDYSEIEQSNPKVPGSPIPTRSKEKNLRLKLNKEKLRSEKWQGKHSERQQELERIRKHWLFKLLRKLKLMKP